MNISKTHLLKNKIYGKVRSIYIYFANPIFMALRNAPELKLNTKTTPKLPSKLTEKLAKTTRKYAGIAMIAGSTVLPAKQTFATNADKTQNQIEQTETNVNTDPFTISAPERNQNLNGREIYIADGYYWYYGNLGLYRSLIDNDNPNCAECEGELMIERDDIDYLCTDGYITTDNQFGSPADGKLYKLNTTDPNNPSIDLVGDTNTSAPIKTIIDHGAKRYMRLVDEVHVQDEGQPLENVRAFGNDELAKNIATVGTKAYFESGGLIKEYDLDTETFTGESLNFNYAIADLVSIPGTNYYIAIHGGFADIIEGTTVVQRIYDFFETGVNYGSNPSATVSINNDGNVEVLVSRAADGAGDEEDNGFADKYTLSLKSLSVDNFEQSSVSVYPNPTTDVVNFKNLPQGKAITLYNIQGQKVAETTTAGNTEAQIDVRHLATGTYIARMPGYRWSKKILKK